MDRHWDFLEPQQSERHPWRLFAETAAGARKWNDANILCMSLRATSEAIAKEMLDAWFSNEPSEDEEDAACLVFLKKAEERNMR
ncbi:MAG: RpiB/LacA/LacB family sugar-phosphate isomerase [Saprospiraceae bacterium]